MSTAAFGVVGCQLSVIPASRQPITDNRQPVVKRRYLLAAIVSLGLARIAFGADCTAVSTLACGTTAASLSSSDCTSSDGSQYRLWQFSGNAGDTVTIDM